MNKEQNSNNANTLLAEVPFSVFQFCKKNGIKCSWDFNRRDGVEWTEIYLDNDMVFQVDKNCKIEQFIELVLFLNDHWNKKNKSDVSGDDFWFAVTSKIVFNKFFKKHEDVFRHFC